MKKRVKKEVKKAGRVGIGLGYTVREKVGRIVNKLARKGKKHEPAVKRRLKKGVKMSSKKALAISKRSLTMLERELKKLEAETRKLRKKRVVKKKAKRKTVKKKVVKRKTVKRKTTKRRAVKKSC